MMRVFTATVLMGMILFIISPGAQAQEIHPKKQVFGDLASWPVTAPGEVELKNFGPFRAVYDRTYRQASGPDAGDPRNDRVIISAEEVGWDGLRAAAITIIDSGIVKHSDTNGRVLTMFVNLDDLSDLFEIGPIPGTAKDYYIGRIMDTGILLNMITTETQKLETQKVETDKPGFGPGAWVMASMKLREGLKINLAPYYSVRGNPLTSASYGHVVDRGEFVSGSGKKYHAWVVETSRDFASSKVSHIHLIDQPPYYLGTETVDLETAERKRFVWLRSVDMLEKQQ